MQNAIQSTTISLIQVMILAGIVGLTAYKEVHAPGDTDTQLLLGAVIGYGGSIMQHLFGGAMPSIASTRGISELNARLDALEGKRNG